MIKTEMVRLCCLVLGGEGRSLLVSMDKTSSDVTFQWFHLGGLM